MNAKTREEEIEERRGKITPGMWAIGYNGPSRPIILVSVQNEPPMLSISGWINGRWASYDNEDNDARFIAHAPADIEYLLDENKRLREALVYIGNVDHREYTQGDSAKVFDCRMIAQIALTNQPSAGEEK